MVLILHPGAGVSIALGGGGPCFIIGLTGSPNPPGGGGGAGLPGGSGDGGAIPGLGGGGGGVGLPGGGGGAGTELPGREGARSTLPGTGGGAGTLLAERRLSAIPGGGGGATGADFCNCMLTTPPGGGGGGGGIDIVGIGSEAAPPNESRWEDLLIGPLLRMPEPGRVCSSVCVPSSLCFFLCSLHLFSSFSPSSYASFVMASCAIFSMSVHILSLEKENV